MVKKISRKFLQGMGSVINLQPRKSYPIKSYATDQSDADRIRGDWNKVGKSISKVITTCYNAKV